VTPDAIQRVLGGGEEEDGYFGLERGRVRREEMEEEEESVVTQLIEIVIRFRL